MAQALLVVLAVATSACQAPSLLDRVNVQLPFVGRQGSTRLLPTPTPTGVPPTATLALATPTPVLDFADAMATAVAIAAARPSEAEPTRPPDPTREALREGAAGATPTAALKPATADDGLLGQVVLYCSNQRFRAFIAGVEQVVAVPRRDGIRLGLVVRAANVGLGISNTYGIAKVVDDKGRQSEMVEVGDGREYVGLGKQVDAETPGWPVRPGEFQRVLWLFQISPDVQHLNLVELSDGSCPAPAQKR
jgi:hypothetical protein